MWLWLRSDDSRCLTTFDALFLTVGINGNFHGVSSNWLFLARAPLSEEQGQDGAVSSLAEGRCWQIECVEHGLVGGLADEDIEALGGVLERDAILGLNVEAFRGEAFND